MKVKAMNSYDCLKEGLNEANLINKVKASFDENIGEKFKEGHFNECRRIVNGNTKETN